MIEQAIYFALGCVVAGLLALGFTPVLWARALRLTRLRLQVQIPVSMQEILADRDQLRAVFAVESRKLEQTMERVRAGKAHDMAELGRRAAAIAAGDDALAAAKSVELALRQELHAMIREVTETAAQLGAANVALHDTQVYFERRLSDFEALRRAHAGLEETLEDRRTTIAALNTRVMGLEMTIEDATRARQTVDKQLEAARQNAQVIMEERDHGATQLADIQAAHDALRRRLVAETAQTAALTQASLTLQNELDKALLQIRTLEAEAAIAMQAAGDVKEREKSLHLEKSLQAEKVRGEGRATLEKLASLQAENAALRGALDAARRRGIGNQDGEAAEPAGVADAILRSSIHELGLAVARMTLTARSEAGAWTDGGRPLVGPLQQPVGAIVSNPS